VQEFKNRLLEKLELKSRRTSDPARALLKAFMYVNSDSMGGIQMHEFRSTMELLGLSGDQVETIFGIFDTSGDNMISRDEFIKEMTR
jgi:Ca2+-binding EF-hand superfamily protein